MVIRATNEEIIDLENVDELEGGDFELLPPKDDSGERIVYRFVANASIKTSKQGKPYVNLDLTVLEPEEWAKRHVFEVLAFSSDDPQKALTAQGKSKHAIHMITGEPFLARGGLTEIVNRAVRTLNGRKFYATVYSRLAKRDEAGEPVNNQKDQTRIAKYIGQTKEG